MKNTEKREAGFLETLIEIFKFSCMLGASIVMTTILYGIMRHSTGVPYYVSFAVLVLTLLSLFSYVYDNALGKDRE